MPHSQINMRPNRITGVFFGSKRLTQQRAYADLSYDPDKLRRGSNDSDKDDYVVTPGESNWADFKLEYVLPLGAARYTGLNGRRSGAL